MPLIRLLNDANSKLYKLSLDRLQLSPGESCKIDVDNQEICIYSLTGKISVAWNGLNSPFVFGEDRMPQDSCVQLCRFPGGHAWDLSIHSVNGYADVLIASCTTVFNQGIQPTIQTVSREHLVGYARQNPLEKTTISRRVREVETPVGYRIHCGETLNEPGAWSSWPSHATPDEAREQYGEHEECFFIITPGYGIIRFDGYWSDGTIADGVHEVRNGDAIVTPLGAHEIVASPGDYIHYVWFYISFLQKTYNMYFTDKVKTYIK